MKGKEIFAISYVGFARGRFDPVICEHSKFASLVY